MTARDALVEKVQAAILSASWPDGQHDGFPTRKVAGMIAPVVLDAVLPQLTTVAELEALPPRTILVGFSDPTVDYLPSPLGHPIIVSSSWHRYLWSGPADSSEELLRSLHSLTVVWQPEATS